MPHPSIENSKPDQSAEWWHSFHMNLRGPNNSVVKSHGKTCLWCEYELTTEQSVDKQEEEYDEDYGDDARHSPRQNDSEVGGAPIQDTFLRRSPRPYYTEGSTVVHQITPDVSSQSIIQQHTLQHSDPGMGGVPPEELPLLLYRWYNGDSQGVNSDQELLAGLFCYSPFFGRDEICDEEFLAFFRCHVTKRKSKTPFISSFRSPLAPIHRAIHSELDAAIAVIDTSKLNTKVFYAHPLAKHTDSFTYSWRGFGEFLIWGQVPTEAIVFTLKAHELERISRTHKDISRLIQLPLIHESFRCNQSLRDRLAAKRKSAYKSGRTLGKLLSLLCFPRIYWESFAQWFTKSWGWICPQEFVQFLSGLRSELPYLDQEHSDSEREECPLTPRQDHQKSRIGFHPHVSSELDSDYEPPESEEISDWRSDKRSLAISETCSVSMEDRTETIDDGQFSTHETLSSFGYETNEVNYPYEDHASDVSSVPQEWPSDGETHPKAPCPFSVEIVRRFEKNMTTSSSHQEMDVLMYEGDTWKRV